MKNFFSKNIKDSLKEFDVTTNGLTNKKARELLESVGENVLNEKKKKSTLSVFIDQFKDLLVIILIIAAVISMATGNIESTIVILAVITINSILGTVQYIKAEQSLASLKSLTSPNAKVIREGIKVEIPSKSVVPGDILILEAGDLVVADGRILENFSLKVNESSLTGESESVDKISYVIDKDEVALGDQKNMVFSSSLVTYGRATVLVTNTGMNTELGKIATLMEETQEKSTPLQASLDAFSKKLALAIIGICILVFGLSLYRGTNVLDSLMFAVALAVAAIPEALSSIVTIVLAIGTQSMAKENAIIKKLKAVEGLGCVSVICSDKTGTLTQNKMTVKKIFVDNKLVNANEIDLKNPIAHFLLTSSILCNDSTSIDGNEIGDPTEVALVNLGHDYSISEIDCRKNHSRLSEIPFDSDRKLMSTLHKIDGKSTMITKGALDVLLDRVTSIKTIHGLKRFTNEDKTHINNINKKLSSQGLRVLAFAYKELNENKNIDLEDENGFTFLGLISMIDPPREESKSAVTDCLKASIKPVMITGDHKITASAIAKEIGILQEDDLAVEGLELDKMSDNELFSKLEHISVYARVSPEHKIRIVKAWQNKGKIVAMTGDGVNDAPALKQADIGIAMGITGTEVSKDAASMILTDDNFATIVKSVTNGRNIYANIKNSIKFLLSGNMSGILAVLYSSLFALPVPFAAVHLLFINLLTDSLPAIAIGMEKSKKDVLRDKPRDANESILSQDFIKDVCIQGLLIGIFTMISYHIGLTKGSDGLAMTMAFSTLCLARLFHGFNCRGRKSIFSLGVFNNTFSWIAFIVGVILVNTVLLIPGLQGLFEVTPLTTSELLSVHLFAFLPTLIIQIFKVIRDIVESKKEKIETEDNDEAKVQAA
ncbi:calcium-transporting ATPase [Clostridium saccharobutylicum]|uniref:cation-translocating P-type ATPase n=1 Tax=Clostridium saccharobutylicum TaxID=169679 RepID=UPI000983F078|nr:cation-translocating P-type ATPase [Clostridium saccharobutylicum]AQS08282.1 calcium-transporting ATPase [Clostridium saccharobutylicum]MBC2435830.1 cation-translocating P-type ATPase [Clostridium saccharobutylicum]NSB88354.1 Ca2+-transporting ATPase [Clostridium saccharobutylicum]NYC29391.1 Ca2+-transporting ATPase [Clostridium saccharobutylicum]OOM10920.1 calcium-transporting ATPase [Clostridium saccharobutylicum]